MPAAHRAATIFAPLLTVSYMASITGGVWLTNFTSFYSQIRNLKKNGSFFILLAQILFSTAPLKFFFFLFGDVSGKKWTEMDACEEKIEPNQTSSATHSQVFPN